MLAHKAIYEFKEFIGLNNYSNSNNLKPNELSIANDINITNEHYLKPRGKLVKVLDGKFEFLYSFENGIYCIKDNDLVFIDSNNNTKMVKVSFGSNRVSFIGMYNNLVVTNGIEIGYIKSQIYNSFESPTLQFRKTMPAGNLLGKFNSRLLVAKNNLLYYSDPMDFRQLKMPNNFIQFEEEITNIIGLRTGIFITSGTNLFFLKGEDILTSTLEPSGLNNVIPYAMTLVPLNFFNEKTPIVASLNYQNISMVKGVYIPTKKDFYIGMEFGRVVNITNDRIILNNVNQGISMFKNDVENINQVMTLI